MSNIDELKNEVYAQIVSSIKHPYLNKHLSIPTIDDVKVTLLVELLVNKNLPNDKIVHYCKALMIHQIALDTHEKVSTYEGTPLDREKKQLTVLEGDFYSGLYYEALAKTGEISLIKELSYAVKEMNEEKINLVHHKFTSLDELLRCITIIESTILVHFANHIEESGEVNRIENKCLITRLEKEIQHLHDNNESDFIVHLQNVLGLEKNNEQLTEALKNIIIKINNEI